MSTQEQDSSSFPEGIQLLLRFITEGHLAKLVKASTTRDPPHQVLCDLFQKDLEGVEKKFGYYNRDTKPDGIYIVAGCMGTEHIVRLNQINYEISITEYELTKCQVKTTERDIGSYPLYPHQPSCGMGYSVSVDEWKQRLVSRLEEA